MYLRFLSGRYAGKIRNVASVPGRAMLADGRAELEYPNQLSAFKPVAAEAKITAPVVVVVAKAPFPGKTAGNGPRERRR